VQLTVLLATKRIHNDDHLKWLQQMLLCLFTWVLRSNWHFVSETLLQSFLVLQ